MTIQPEPKVMSLSGLSHRCREESEHFFHHRAHDPSYCYELFRRAIYTRDDQAWACIYQQYRPLVTSWVTRHSMFASIDEEVDYFINRSFEKMWSAISPEKLVDFEDLTSILRYLQLCVHSCIVDYARAQEQAEQIEETNETSSFTAHDHLRSLEERAARQAEASALWEWLEKQLKTKQERTIVYGSFVLGMKPRAIYTTFQDLFHSIDEVYQAKENVLTRLRRDPELLRYLAEME